MPTQRSLFDPPGAADAPEPPEHHRVHARHRYPTIETVALSEATQRSIDDPTAADLADVDRLRPRTRADCHPARAALVAHLPEDDDVRLARPCPWIRCRFHLHADISVSDETGAAVLEIHRSAPWEHTCLLDVIDAASAAPELAVPLPRWLVTDSVERCVVEAADEQEALDIAWTLTEFIGEPEVTVAPPEADAIDRSAVRTNGIAEIIDPTPDEPTRDLLGDEALGDVLGISGEWVRQITRRAVPRMQAGLAEWRGEEDVADARVVRLKVVK